MQILRDEDLVVQAAEFSAAMNSDYTAVLGPRVRQKGGILAIRDYCGREQSGNAQLN
jgi:hypothetical protein